MSDHSVIIIDAGESIAISRLGKRIINIVYLTDWHEKRTTTIRVCTRNDIVCFSEPSDGIEHQWRHNKGWYTDLILDELLADGPAYGL